MGSSAEQQIIRIRNPRTIVALVLSAVAGYVDAVGYVFWDRVLIANMSGNTISAAAKTAERTFPGNIFRLWPLALFVLGVIAGAVIHGWTTHRRRIGSLSVALWVECGLLAATLLVGKIGHGSFVSPEDGARWFVPVGIASFALGLQNATLTRVGPVTVFTTHVTGTLTKFGQDLVEAAYCFKDARASGGPGWRTLRGSKSFSSMLFFLGMFLLFAAAAAVGAWAQVHLGIWSLAAPTAVIGITAAGARRL